MEQEAEKGRRLRLGFAFAASLVLHTLLLFPFAAPAPRLAPTPKARIEARLIVPVLANWATNTEAALPKPPQKPSSAASSLGIARPLAGRRLESILAAMVHDEFYPRAAIERGLEGTVILLLTLDGSGRVQAVSLTSSSGHALLDEAALSAAQRIASVPGVRGQVLLPVEFRLE